MLLASIASLISNSKILHEIGACQEVLLVFLKRVCQNLRNSNKTNLTYSTKERYFSLSRLAIKGEVRLSELPEPAAEVGVHGKIPFIQVECFYRQLAPCAGQLQELVLIGDPAAIPILPGRHYQQALLFQTGHGGADRVLAQTAPLLYGGVTDGRCAQAVLAVR